MKRLIVTLFVLFFPFSGFCADLSIGGEKQPTNWIAISMFGGFVLLSLVITRWASTRTKTASDFYTAGGKVSGFQNGLAIAGDYMSAASFLGISAQIFADGYDGLIYSIGFLVGWPIIMFLMAEKLRNLGRFTFGDVVSYRFAQPPTRIFAAFSTLIVVLFYLIAQMVGAGQLIKLLFGLPYSYAVMIVGGNIDGVTRVMTTAIALETSKGDLPLALGLGMVLVMIIIGVNLLAHGVKVAAQHRYG